MTSITIKSRFDGSSGDAHEVFPAEHEVAFDNERTRVDRRRRHPLLADWRWGSRGTRKSARRVTDSHRTHAILDWYHPGLLFVVACLSGTLMVSAAEAQEPIIKNGSFETGDYSGWTLFEGGISVDPIAGIWGIVDVEFEDTIESGDMTFDFFDGIRVPQIAPAGLPHTYSATEGQFVAYQLQNGGQTHRMYQDITLCSSASIKLSWDMEYRNNSNTFESDEQVLKVTIRDQDPLDDRDPLDDGDIRRTVFTTQEVDSLEETWDETGMKHFSFDIPEFAGEPVRLSVDLNAQRTNFNAAFDNFRVEGCDVIPDVVCELKVVQAGKDEDETTVASLQNQRVAKSLHFETVNTDPRLPVLWNALFRVAPGTSLDDALTLKADHEVTWEVGTLVMGGLMKVKVKTDKKEPGLKRVKIEKAGKKEGTTTFITGTGGVNPNLFAGGWHEVKIKNMLDVTVTFDGETITGFLKELKVKLAKDSPIGAPVVKDFKIDITGVTTATDVKKGIISSVEIAVPETVVTALVKTEYEEKIKNAPKLVNGHTEAEFKRERNATTEGVDISSLIDGVNDQLKERKGACSVAQ